MCVCVCDSVCVCSRGSQWLKSFRESHVTAEWEERELDGHGSPTQASSVLLFVLVMVEPKERMERRFPPFTLNVF